MSAHQPTKKGVLENLGNLIRTPGAGRSAALVPADPPTATLIEVPVAMIDLCDLNPRQQENEPFFKRLLEAVRINGIDTPIPITRRPGSEKFMVAAGGNTRIKVLRALRADPGNGAKFDTAPCIFRPYTSDIDILAAHLRENDLRDDLVFIDHALAIQALKAMLEASRGVALGDTELERSLREMGHPISRRELGRMGYAVAVLWPAIPGVLRAGAGPSLVDAIGRLQTAYRTVYDALAEGLPESASAPAFDMLFADELGLHDGDALDLDELKTSIDHRIAQIVGVPPNRVRLEADMALLPKKVFSTPDPAAEAPPPPATSMRAPAVGEPRLVGGDTGGTGRRLDIPPIPPTQNPAHRPAAELAAEGFGTADAGQDAGGAAAPSARLPQPAHATGQAVPPSAFPPPAAWPEPLPATPEASAPLAASAFPAAFPPSPAWATASDPAGPNSPFAPAADVSPPGGRRDADTAAQAVRLARAAGFDIEAWADGDAPGGFRPAPLRPGADADEAALWWLLAALAGGSLAGQGRTPAADDTLARLIELVESVAGLARQRARSTILMMEDAP